MKKLADRLFRWFCHPAYYPDIKGDLEEMYQDHLADDPNSATRKYLGDVLLLMRPSLMKPILNLKYLDMSMLKNHFKIAWRINQRDRSFAGINVLGLALGMAIALLIIQYVRFEFSYETMFPKADQIVRMTTDYMDGGVVIEQDCETYPPLGNKMVEVLPEVVNFARTYNMEELRYLKIGDRYIMPGTIYAADSGYFSMFDIEVEGVGDGAIFTQPNQAILTKSLAKNVFGTADAIGQVFKIKEDTSYINLQVVGLIPDSPGNTHLKYDMLISYPTLIANFGESEDNWGGNNTYTFVELVDGGTFERFNAKLPDFNQRLMKELEEDGSVNFVAQPLKDIHLYSNKSFEAEANGDAQSVMLLLGVAILVIVIAFVNYINLSTSKAIDRAREVGVRKVVGSTLFQLRGQFLTESFLITLFAGTLTLFLVFLAQPYFIAIAGLPLNFQIFSDPVFWSLLAGFVFLGSMLAGFYPAMILSSFRVADTLHGRSKTNKQGSVLRRALVVLQFAITIVLLSQTLTVVEQLSFMRNKDLGVDLEQTLVVQMPPTSNLKTKFKSFTNDLYRLPAVTMVTNSECVPGLPGSQMSTSTHLNPVDAIEEHSYNFYITRIDSMFLPTMGIELLAGENFDFTSSWDKDLIVNEETIRLWGYSSPEEAIGKVIDFWGKNPKIKGVVANYHQESAKQNHLPIIWIYASGVNALTSIKMNVANALQHVAQIQEAFETHYPNRPFSFFFLDEQYDQQFKSDQRFQQVFSILTVFAIVIACLGLFGLASFVVAKRTKEIGIRKVIGASSLQIMILLSNDFVKTILIAITLAIPVAYYLVENWLAGFAFRIELNPWLFVLPGVLVVVLAILSLSIKTIITAVSNPVDSLRDE